MGIGWPLAATSSSAMWVDSSFDVLHKVPHGKYVTLTKASAGKPILIHRATGERQRADAEYDQLHFSLTGRVFYIVLHPRPAGG